MKRRAFMLGLGASAAAAKAARAEGDAALELTVADYGLIFAPIAVNGHAASALIDTGSVRGIQLSERLRQTADLRADTRAGANQRYDASRQVFAGFADDFVFGGFRATAEPVQVIPGDIEQIARQTGASFDAILGWPLLSRFDFVIDYRARTMRLAGGEADRAPRRLPLDRAKNLPVTAMKIASEGLLALVDTGAPTCNLDAAIATEVAGTLVTRNVEIAGRELALQFRVKDLTPIRRALDCRAVLGHNFLNGRALSYIKKDHAFALS